jgi:hypothetical protein
MTQIVFFSLPQGENLMNEEQGGNRLMLYAFKLTVFWDFFLLSLPNRDDTVHVTTATKATSPNTKHSSLAP